MAELRVRLSALEQRLGASGEQQQVVAGRAMPQLGARPHAHPNLGRASKSVRSRHKWRPNGSIGWCDIKAGTRSTRNHVIAHRAHRHRHKGHLSTLAAVAGARRRRPPPTKLLLIKTIALIALMCHTNNVDAFNVDTNSALVHSGSPNSFFGYTVAMHKDRNANWLLVGAPKAATDQPNVTEAGAVYRCSASAARACQPILFDPNGSSQITMRDGKKVQADDKSHQFFGASLQSATDNGSIVACAPKYTYFSTNFRRRDPVGACWVSRGSFGGFLEYSPCRLNDQWGHHKLGSCQAGFSSAISKDGSRVFMGAPGAYVWQGQVFAHNMRTDLANATSSMNPRSEDDSYLGYSMAVGRFSAPATGNPNDAAQIDVAIGIPRADDLVGKVMLVDREMRFLRNITGEQLGAYFGYSIAVADVNGDGLDDLLVGAPLYYNRTLSNKEPHFERGRVYVLLQNFRHDFSLAQRLDGHKNRARFGTAIANCGDLNRDGIQDVAIGAPYDGPNGHGAVYIYMGRKHGLGAQNPGVTPDYDQVIYAESIRNADLRSFGFSLSSGLDVDSNQYPDLLVGDYEAARAVLLRTRPVVNITTSLTFQPEHFNLDEKACVLPNTSTSVSCVTAKYCIKYSGTNVEANLPFVFDRKLDTEAKGAPRLFFLHNPTKNEERVSSTLTRDVNQCSTFKAFIMSEVRDKLTPLKVDVDYNLAEHAQMDSYDPILGQPKLKPILNKITPISSAQAPVTAAKLSKVATIQKNCGSDNLCVPDLKLTMNPNSDQFTIGSNEKLVLDVTVKNYGDDAYESMFYLTMPTTINYIAINKTRNDYPICHGPRPEQTGVNVLTCDLGNPQPRNDVVKFSVITEPVRVSQFSSQDFTFIANVNSTNPEQDDRHREDNHMAVGIPIRVEVDLVLSGSSNPPLVVHNSNRTQLDLNRAKFSEADLGPEVYHTYQLQNKGPSTIHDIAVSILWPTRMKDGENFLLYPVDEPVTTGKVRCKPAPEDAINPLRLKYMKGNSINVANSQQQQQQTRLFKRQVNSVAQEPTLSSAYYTSPITTSVDDSVLQQLNLAPYNPAQWTRFDCNVFDLANNEIGTIKIRSRLYEDTIDKLGLQEFDISSRLVAQIKALPYNVSAQSMDPYMYKVETQVHTTGSGLQELLPWWMIVLAILLGIALFVLLAYFLKYLGFFARKRPPKGAEREPLTPTMWNDYHYTPGDTAL